MVLSEYVQDAFECIHITIFTNRFPKLRLEVHTHTNSATKKEPPKMVLLVKETHLKDNHILSSKLLHHFLKLSYWRGRCEAKFIRELSSCKRRKKFHLMNKLHVVNQRIICSSWRGPRVTRWCAPIAYRIPSISTILCKHSH